MILNSRNNLFNFKFPRTFVPKEVADKYRKYLNRMPGNLITEPIDFINYSIQGVALPGLSFDPIEQAPNDGTITYHTLLYYYSKDIRKPFLDDLKLQILDAEGIHVMSAVFEKPIMNSITELELNMSSNIAEFNTFTLNFYYNKFNLKLEID